MTTYRNFWIRIENRADGIYVSSNSRAGGAVSAPLQLSDPEAYQLSALLGASVGAQRGEPGAGHRNMGVEGAPARLSGREVGAELFDALFPGPVRDAFMRNLGGGRDNGVRIRLQIDPHDPALAKLAALPWELVYNDVTRKALGRSKYTPVVRSLDVAQSYEVPPFRPPLRVLLVLASPSDAEGLDLDGEKARVLGILETLDDVEVTVLEHATERRLYDALDTGRFDVLHYMGHGGFDDRRGGVLFLEDEHGRSAPVSAAELGDDLAERRAMRLVFLNACDTGRASHAEGADPFTGVASALVAAGIPAVVAMQVPVADTAALAFAGKFYDMIAHGEPVDAAVAVGRRAIFREDEASLMWATPVLFMRTEDGYLFTPPEAPEAPAPLADPTPLARPAPPTRQAPPRAEPAAPRPPAPTAGQKLKKGGVALLAGVGALFVIMMIAFWDEEDDLDAYDDGPDVAGFVDDEFGPVPPAAPAGGAGAPLALASAQEMILTSGLGSFAGHPELVRVASWMVEERNTMENDEELSPIGEALLLLSTGGAERWPVTLEPGGDYSVRGTCDRDCGELVLRLYAMDGTLLVQDSGTEPVLDVQPTSYQDGAVEAVLTDCPTGQCFVGVGVYVGGL